LQPSPFPASALATSRSPRSLPEPALAPLWIWLRVGEVPSADTLLGRAIVAPAITCQALFGTPPGPLPMA
jgi:hypothetical protein